jgi:hypothetical protein
MLVDPSTTPDPGPPVAHFGRAFLPISEPDIQRLVFVMAASSLLAKDPQLLAGPPLPPLRRATGTTIVTPCGSGLFSLCPVELRRGSLLEKRRQATPEGASRGAAWAARHRFHGGGLFWLLNREGLPFSMRRLKTLRDRFQAGIFAVSGTILGDANSCSEGTCAGVGQCEEIWHTCVNGRAYAASESINVQRQCGSRRGIIGVAILK